MRNANPSCNLPHNGHQQSVQHLSRALQQFQLEPKRFLKATWAGFNEHLLCQVGLRIHNRRDGNHYIDYMMALLPVVLGYADPFVDAAVVKQLALGNCLSLAGSLEAELSEKLASLICAEMVRLAKMALMPNSNSQTCKSLYRKRKVVCGYHGWHDWYIGSTTKNLGVPTAVGSLTETIPFNDAEALADLLKQNGDKFGACN